jgi:hypothetical protein
VADAYSQEAVGRRFERLRSWHTVQGLPWPPPSAKHKRGVCSNDPHSSSYWTSTPSLMIIVWNSTMSRVQREDVKLGFMKV